MAETKRKNKPGAGRKAEGRVRRNVLMLPEAWAEVDARHQGKGDTVGKIIERALGVPGSPPAGKNG